MRKIYFGLLPGVVTTILLVVLQPGCSNDISSYDEIEKAGEIESVARKNYDDFFRAVKLIGTPDEKTQETSPDSSLIMKAASLTERLNEDIQEFPSTVKSRIALDALSYGAGDLALSSNFSITEVERFWQNTLIMKLISFGHDFMKSGNTNESAHLQLLKAIHRGVGTHISEEILMYTIPVIGATPSQKVMEFCETDSLFLKKINDLIIYTRSLQKADPPVWMLSGSWFLAIEFADWPIIFMVLQPLMVDDVPYITFKDFNLGDIYAAVYDDPVPSDKTKWDAWLTRGNTIMSNLVFDDLFADRIRNCELTTYDAHNFYHDYLLHADVDTTRKVFHISFSRKKFQQSAFEFTGMDSIAVIFSSPQIEKPDGDITILTTTRTTGASMIGGTFYSGRTLYSRSYLMPFGIHDDNKVKNYQKFSVEVNEVPG